MSNRRDLCKPEDFKPRRGFMDLTDFAFELEGAPEVKVYPTALELARKRGVCLDECGIVEVEVRVVRVLLSPRRPG